MVRPTIYDRPIPWVSETLIDFNGIQVELCEPPDLYDRQSSENHLILGKPRWMVDELLEITETLDARMIIDVGVYKGGSVVFLNEVFRPEKLVGIERNPVDIPALTQYCNDPARIDRIRVFLGVDQADQPALGRIFRHEFGNQPLDLVVDDASHFFEETRGTFRALFPRLRPGGLYVIEDWGWAHWPEDFWQNVRGDDYFRGKTALSTLITELMLLCASSPQLVTKVTINHMVAYIERGPGALDPGFELSEYCLNRSEAVRKIGTTSAPSMVFSSPTFVIRR